MNEWDDRDEDGYHTSMTFDTPGEAQAFLRGFFLAGAETIFVHVDPQEPQTILIDITDEDGMEVYLKEVQRAQESRQ